MNINQNLNQNQPAYIPQNETGLGFVPNVLMNMCVQVNHQYGAPQPTNSWNGTVTYYLNLIGKSNFPQQAFDAVTQQFPTLRKLFFEVQAVANIIKDGNLITVPCNVQVEKKIANDNRVTFHFNAQPILPEAQIAKEQPEIKKETQEIPQATSENIPVPPPLPPQKKPALEAKKVEKIIQEKILEPKKEEPQGMDQVFAQIRQGAVLKKVQEQPKEAQNHSEFKNLMQARRKQLEDDSVELNQVQSLPAAPQESIKKEEIASVPKKEGNWSQLMDQIRNGLPLKKVVQTEKPKPKEDLASMLEKTSLFKRMLGNE